VLDGAAPDLIVDALFGTGLTRPVSGVAAAALQAVGDWQGRQAVPVPVVAVDLPSGLCADSGRRLGAVLPAALTVTFHRARCGHYLAEGPDVCGAVEVVDIGLPQDDDPASLRLVGPPPRALLAKGAGHKFSYGHALVLSGGVGKGGAGRLAARAALRSGAGLVTLGCPPAALIENAARLDAVMLRAVRDAEGWAGMLADDRITAVCLGPGLGLGPREAALVRATLTARPGQPPGTCLDADALTLLGRDPDLMGLLHPGCVLTPHGGEFGRLFPDLAEQLAAPATTGPAMSKADAVRAAAQRAGCTVLLKGADTVIAEPSGRCAVHAAQYDLAAPWLATAGSGDVLAGIITGLMARGVPPMEAATAGAWLHAAAARAFGPGLIAEDLPDQLPVVFRNLEV
jgi:ADP-dependent NAD(P)H-hydrate dehydratase / NAD(P)H-hydrate epimerase